MRLPAAGFFWVSSGYSTGLILEAKGMLAYFFQVRQGIAFVS